MIAKIMPASFTISTVSNKLKLGGGGDMAKISYHHFFQKHHDFITILCHVGFTIL